MNIITQEMLFQNNVIEKYEKLKLTTIRKFNRTLIITKQVS